MADQSDRSDTKVPAGAIPAPVEGVMRLRERLAKLDPVLEVDYDTWIGVNDDPEGARQAIEDALYLLRDQQDQIEAMAEALQWQIDTVEKAITPNGTSTRRVILDGVPHVGPLADWCHEVFTRLVNINRRVLDGLGNPPEPDIPDPADQTRH